MGLFTWLAVNYSPQILLQTITKLSQLLLDNISSLRTLPRVPKRTYYELREVSLSKSFTPGRADARSVHHLPLSQYGDEPPDSAVTSGWSDANGHSHAVSRTQHDCQGP